MKEYEGTRKKIIINDENISIINKRQNATKESFSFSDVNKLMWMEPKGDMLGSIRIKVAPKDQIHFVNFEHTNREMFLELRDLISQKSNVDFQIETFGKQASDTFKLGLKALFWLGLGIALFLSAMHNLFGIFG